MKKRVGLLTLDIRKAEEAGVEELASAVKVETEKNPGGLMTGFELSKIDNSIYLSSTQSTFIII